MRAGERQIECRARGRRHAGGRGSTQTVIVVVPSDGDRQRDTNGGLPQLRKKLLESEMTKPGGVEVEFAHRQPVSRRQHVIGKDQQPFVYAVEFFRPGMQAHQPLLRVQTLFHP